MSELDAEGIAFWVAENMPQKPGFGKWQPATKLLTTNEAKVQDLATAYFEIADPDDDLAMIHLIAQRDSNYRRDNDNDDRVS